MATTHPLAAFCELANAFVDKQVASRSKGGTYVPPALAHPSKLEHLYGCSSCSFSEVGCKHCWDTPFASRPASRAKPSKGHAQAQLPAAPTFRPTAEEFRDPFAYLASIAPQAHKAGIAHIVPPEGWQPPIQMLDQETGMLRKDFQVPTRIQPTHLLCKRYPTPSGAPPASLAGNSSPGSPSTPQQQQQQQEAKASAVKKSNAVTGRCSKSSMDAQKAAVAAAAAAAAAAVEEGKDVILNPAHWDAVATAAEATDGQFGYEHLEDPLSLAEFHRYADWAKRRHFNGPLMAGSSSSNGRRPDSAAGSSSSSSKPAVASASNAWRAYPCTAAGRAARGVAGKYLPGTCPAATAPTAAAGDAANPAAAAAAPQDPAEVWQEPSIEEVEAEFWRIVEAADEQVEALYGQDIDTATYSSAFPTIKELAQAEARNLVKQRGSSSSTAPNTAATTAADDEAALDPANCCASCRCGSCQLCELRAYASHPWNINNLPQARGSVLRFVREDVGGKPITGLMVPWVYVGSCFSAFCWHIEDHGLYSINYNHMGAPKVWYGVPAEAAAALDAAMRDALPHLFERDRLLLHKLITMLSPSQLVARGVPVCRAVQTPGSFIVTFPDAYHAGFNSGFNVAEAVNFAAPDWLPFGSSSVVRYRCESRYMTFSHDAMLINVRMLFKPPSPTLAALAAGELALRLEVEGQRQAALALQAGISRTALMQGSAAAHDPASGVHINTQGVECATCGGDLSLAAVVSDADPGRAVCPEHIADLDGSRSQRLLLLRYAPGELQSLLSAAMRLVPGARQAVSKARQRQGWVAAGRFMGGAVLQKPAEVGSCTAGSAAVAAVAVKQEPGTEQQQQQAAAAVKQELAAEQQQPARQRPQQPVVEVKMLGRLYHPDDIDRKLFEDLDELGSSDFEDEEEEELLQQQQQQRWEGVGDMEAEDDDADAAAAADGAAGKLAGKQQHQEEAADEDAEEGASGGEQSSGSWWQDELDGMEDAFGFYTFAAADADSDDEGALEGSDGDFMPRRSGCRKRRRRAAGADGGSMRGKRVAMSDTAAAAVVEAAA
ncbi:hypothetical protein OEZ85_002169 [Tetradesmus obliquus]|uniref:JmjC domain-containing protein n=1 Tax=Tetradesmus obliquus TaxID=3088 RepID=A0ABY8U2E8_TETOB|nr:hypothetical protein OEZ85_002169 [Tetradesmus obliquus]